MQFNPKQFNIGILGAGQLGKMMAQEGSRFDFQLSFLDQSHDFPAGKLTSDFFEGDFNNYDDVMSFGQTKDIITIEIEHVNLDALFELEKIGKKVYPQPAVLQMIKDKGLQKQFLIDHNIPSSPFLLFNTVDEILLAINHQQLHFPFVQKLREGGYDGKGVEIIRSENDLSKLMKGPSLCERLADINKEIAVIAVRNPSGECISYPAVSMDFHPTANLVEYLVCPAEIPTSIEASAKELAIQIANQLNIVGLLAVEMFYNKDGSIWINEMAPRPHNSGHHTLDNGATSQFLNHLLAISDLPLGQTNFDRYAIMLNILGEPSFTGDVQYEGIGECIQKEGVHIHLYGKKETKPFRKMGHVTITGNDLASCKEKANFVRENLKAKT